MKTSEQLKALIRNFSANKNVDTGTILQKFIQERFLERVSVSKYKDNFIFKGGMLIAAIVGISSRTTMDVDATIKGQTLTELEIIKIINDILNVSVDDNVVFTFRNIEEIREDDDYPGYRVSIDSVFDKTRQTLKVDITTGDIVTPREVEFYFPLMFENRTINIMAYNLETILAEKFETIITRGVTNTRMRDFYDIYILTTTQAFDNKIFVTALKNVAQKRDTIEQMTNTKNVIQTIAESVSVNNLWNRYQKKYNYAANVTWDMVIEALNELV